MKRGLIALAGVAAAAVFLLVAVGKRPDGGNAAGAAPVPVLSVAVTRPKLATLPMSVPASGNVAAWQESIVGAEVDGLRLIEVRVNVGDEVTRGQVLAVFSTDVIDAEIAAARAEVAQAHVAAMEADDNYQRMKKLDASRLISAQQAGQYAAAALTARARLDAVRAVEKMQLRRREQARVLAPGDGIITARAATVGAVVPAGQELFRLIRDGRLEWRANVSVDDLARLRPGQVATIQRPGQAPVRGELRMLAPDIDTRTQSGLVYVDLPRDGQVRAGEFVTGTVETGAAPALTLPVAAVLARDGFEFVMVVGPDSTVRLKKVVAGRRIGDRIEVAQGLSESEEVIASGLGFLNEGDTVRVVAPDIASDSGDAGGSRNGRGEGRRDATATPEGGT